MKVYNTALIGAGPGCVSIIDMVAGDRHSRLRLNLVGVADKDHDAPGMDYARRLNIYTSTDYNDLLSIEDLDIIIELTGDEEINHAILRRKPDRVLFMGHAVAELFLDFVRLERERLNAEKAAKRQAEAINLFLKDLISLEEHELAAEREAEQRIRAERDYTQKILDSLPQALVVVDRDFAVENANQTFLNEFGFTRDEVLGRPCHEVLFHKNAVCSKSVCPFLQGISPEIIRVESKEFTLEREGEVVYYEAHHNPLIDQDGNFGRCLLSMSNITHRRRLELDLDRSQRRYRKLFQEARDGIVLFDKQGNILESNMSLARMLGHSTRMAGTKVWELARGESRKILEFHLKDLEIMGFVLVEMEFVRSDGSMLPVEADILYLPEEEIYQAMIRDITTRRKLEESRKLYSERLEKEVEERTKDLSLAREEALRQRDIAEGIIYGSPIPMFVLDRDHLIGYWNKACERLTGFPAEEMIGTDNHWKPFYPTKRPLLADLVMEGDVEGIDRLYAGMNPRKSPIIEGAYEAEFFFPHLGDEGTHLYFNAAPIRDDNGSVQGAIVTYQDFSERAKMTQEIKRREAFVRNLVENSIDGIIATDSRGKIVIFNQGAVDILGYTPEEILGRLSYTEILSKETMKKIRDGFYRDVFGPVGKIINMEVELLNREGEPIPVRLSGTLLFENQKEVGSVVFIQDLREVLRLQREKAQAERMAAIGQTVAGVAHYIKNILNGLRGGSYVINSAMNKGNMDQVEKGWKMVEKNIDQITQIVMDMLIYSKERRPDFQPVDPNDLVRDVIELMQERARISNVTLVSEPDPGLRQVLMDKTAIHRCLLNLVSNAIDACTLEGIMGGDGRVTVRTDKPEGFAVRFQVEDNGIGMSKETQKKIFTNFFSTKGYKGTGLGLPVTQKIVGEHSGKLLFETEEGRGTTFSLLLPEQDAGAQDHM